MGFSHFSHHLSRLEHGISCIHARKQTTMNYNESVRFQRLTCSRLAVQSSWCFVLVSCVSWQSALVAQSNTRSLDVTHVGFVPGDAFFAIRLNGFRGGTSLLFEIDPFLSLSESRQNDGENAPISKELLLEYRDPQFKRSQVAVTPVRYGFRRIAITDYSERNANILYALFQAAEDESTQLSVEGQISSPNGIPGVSALIMNRDVPLDVIRFFNRYNEDWMIRAVSYFGDDEITEIKALMYPGLYQPHVWLPEAVADDWKLAKKVPPLTVDIPMTLEMGKGRHREIGTAVSIRFKECVFLAFPHDDPERAYHNYLNTTYYLADESGVYRCRWVLSSDNKKRTSREKLYDPDKERSE